MRLCGLLADRVRVRIEALVQAGHLAVGCSASVLNRDGAVFAVAPGFRGLLRGSSAMTLEATYELRTHVALRVTVSGYAQVEIPRGYDGTSTNANLVIRWMLHMPEQTPAQVLTEVGIAALLSSDPADQSLVASGITTVAGSLVDEVVRALTLRVAEEARQEDIDLEGL